MQCMAFFTSSKLADRPSNELEKSVGIQILSRKLQEELWSIKNWK